jgi:hypothetical protein
MVAAVPADRPLGRLDPAHLVKSGVGDLPGGIARAQPGQARPPISLQCTDAGGTTFDPQSAGSPTSVVTIDEGRPFYGVACPSVTFCVLAGDDIAQGDPMRASSWGPHARLRRHILLGSRLPKHHGMHRNGRGRGDRGITGRLRQARGETGKDQRHDSKACRQLRRISHAAVSRQADDADDRVVPRRKARRRSRARAAVSAARAPTDGDGGRGITPYERRHLRERSRST